MAQDPKTYNQIAGQKVQRLEAISDGVFAIALTLLVLDIKVPVGEALTSEGELFAALFDLMPRFLSYFLSFMTLGIFWTGHSAQFQYINKSDRHLNWITLFFLMFVSLLPFTTAFLSEYINFKLAVGLYWLNIFALGLMLFISWRYAFQQNYVNFSGSERKVVDEAIKKRIVIAQALYAVGALLCFINTYLSILMIVLIQLNYALALFSQQSNNQED